MQKRISN